MKRILCLFLMAGIILTFSGCSRFEVHGLENFSENACSLGLNDGLLPGDRQFLSDYAYEAGDYHYWYADTIRQIKAKTFVRLQYPESIYLQAKSACEAYYPFAAEAYRFEGFVFPAPASANRASGSPSLGMQIFGYNDAACTLIFIGCYGYAYNRLESTTESDFAGFVSQEFGAHFSA